jgi:cytoskeletal protein CcmA (bactofilin family)
MMFGKDADKLRSLLGPQSAFSGDLNAKGILRVDGEVTGRIQADQVILSETAILTGDIVATKITVSGKVEGCLKASDLVEIKSKGKVKGEIFANKLVVAEGGELNGRIEMGADETKILDFELRNQEISLKH